MTNDKVRYTVDSENQGGRPSSSPVDSRTEEKSLQVKTRPECEPSFRDYLRVFTYATKLDLVVYVLASVASVGAGTTMPLMNIFGQLVSQFTGYFSDPPTTTRAEFERMCDKQALYILALFLGRLFLNYINKFCFRMIGIRLSSAVRLPTGPVYSRARLHALRCRREYHRRYSQCPSDWHL